MVVGPSGGVGRRAGIGTRELGVVKGRFCGRLWWSAMTGDREKSVPKARRFVKW